MTGTRDWLTRERGSRDWRLLPAAICGWTASLAAHAGFAYCMSHDGMLGALPAVLTCMIPLAVLAGLPFPRLPASVRRRITLWHASVTVCAIAAMVCAASALTYDLLQWRDPASRAAAEGDASVVVTARAPRRPSSPTDGRTTAVPTRASHRSPSTAYGKPVRHERVYTRTGLNAANSNRTAPTRSRVASPKRDTVPCRCG